MCNVDMSHHLGHTAVNSAVHLKCLQEAEWGYGDTWKSALPLAEPLLERWPFSVAYHHEGAQLQLMFSSDACLNLVATPAAFRSIGDARSFLQAMSVPASPAASSAAAPATVVPTNKIASLCSNYRQAPLVLHRHRSLSDHVWEHSSW